MKKLIITIALAILLCSCDRASNSKGYTFSSPERDQANSQEQQVIQLKRIADGIDSLNKGIRGL